MTKNKSNSKGVRAAKSAAKSTHSSKGKGPDPIAFPQEQADPDPIAYLPQEPSDTVLARAKTEVTCAGQISVPPMKDSSAYLGKSVTVPIVHDEQ